MKIMLCGASDTKSIREAFENVVSGFGAQAMTFLTATHTYENSSYSSSSSNSRASVRDAQICVFVIKGSYGSYTWNDEFDEVLREGVPFIVMCDESKFNEYQVLCSKKLGFPDEEKQLFELIDKLVNFYDLAICPFVETSFEKILRYQLGQLVEIAMKKYTSLRQRESAKYLLKTGTKLSKKDIYLLKEIALDEYELKRIRKDAILRLSEYQSLDKDSVIDLIESPEQGVSRFTLDNIDKLMPSSEYSKGFLCECVQTVNSIDDTGARRRLIMHICDVDLEMGLYALDELLLNEVGSKRRLINELVSRKDEIISAGLQEQAMKLAAKCFDKKKDDGWKEEGEKFISEMKGMMQ